MEINPEFAASKNIKKDEYKAKSIFCEKHGNITNGSQSFEIVFDNDNALQSNYYCLRCFVDYLEYLKEKDILAKTYIK